MDKHVWRRINDVADSAVFARGVAFVVMLVLGLAIFGVLGLIRALLGDPPR